MSDTPNTDPADDELTDEERAAIIEREQASVAAAEAEWDRHMGRGSQWDTHTFRAVPRG